MKKFIFVVTLILTLIIFDKRVFGDTIYNVYYKLNNDKEYKIIENTEVLNTNNYFKKDVSKYVVTTDSLIAKDKQELMNIYYSAINKGYDKLTFYCDEEYYNCDKDIEYLSTEDSNFSYINQLVNVYNSYKSITTSYSSNLRVDITVNKKYNEEDIKRINDEIYSIIDKLHLNDYDDIFEKIRLFHDYLARINSYDEDMANTMESNYNSDSAIGALFEGKAICSGYTDAMSLFLDILGIENYRVATDKHVWNALKVNNKWYHIDLTWDDPIVSDGSNMILEDYFMISTDELLSKNDPDHNFDREIYNFID